jgi:hypothetical protein
MRRLENARPSFQLRNSVKLRVTAFRCAPVHIRPCAGRHRFGGPSVGSSEPIGVAPITVASFPAPAACPGLHPPWSRSGAAPIAVGPFPTPGGVPRIGPGRCTVRTDPGATLEPMPPCLSAVALFRAAVASGVRIGGGLRSSDLPKEYHLRTGPSIGTKTGFRKSANPCGHDLARSGLAPHRPWSRSATPNRRPIRRQLLNLAAMP